MQRRNLKRGGFFDTVQVCQEDNRARQTVMYIFIAWNRKGSQIEDPIPKQRKESIFRGTSEAPKIWNILSFLSGGFPEDKVGSWKLKCSAILICLRRKTRWFFWMSGIIWKKLFFSGGFPEDRVGSWSAVQCRLPATSTHKPGPSLNNHLWASS